MVISATSAFLFVFLAGFNVWNMLAGPGTSARSKRMWTQIHRVAGYAFIALFVISAYFMFLRIKGSSDELPPHVLMHMSLALSLAPLLLVKVMVARYQKGARSPLLALGICIFLIAFVMVALNLVIHFLRLASTDSIPPVGSLIFVCVVLIVAAIVLLNRHTHSEPKSATEASSSDNATEWNARTRSEPLNLVLVRVEPQTGDARTLRFLLPPDRRLTLRPGQFLTFEWMIDGKPVTRSYSVCSSPTQTGYIEITAKRVANGRVSQFLNDRARPGLSVRARGPYGQFYFDENKHKRVVFVAGGSGITPMMAMLRYIDDLCIPVDSTLIYCVRTDQDLLFKGELETLQRRLHRFHYIPVLSQAGPEWTGWKGRLRREILEHEIENPLESAFFLCGPPAFMEHSRALLENLSVGASRIMQESFGSAVTRKEVLALDAGLLNVSFARSGMTCSVSAEKNLLESCENNGMLLPSGCRQGSCGTCATKLLNGDVHMEQKEGLNDDLRSQGYILPCVSRPLGDVTLDA
jgi:ferredoxin-NADP reductase